MMMGRKPEPFLRACLDSIHGAVDLLVLNDNSQDPEGPNMVTVKEHALYGEGKIHVIPSEFKGFGYCRSLCLDYLKELNAPSLWVLYLDADEVHPPALRAMTRGIIPSLPENIGIVDGYKYEFFQSRNYFLFCDRRHNLFFRFNPDIRWEGKVHEKPVNLRGHRVAFPYRYFHYGYLISAAAIKEKWKLYSVLEEKSDSGEDYDRYLRRDACRVLRFSGSHPAVARECLEAVENENRGGVERFERLVRENESVSKVSRSLKRINVELNMKMRALQCALAFFSRSAVISGLGELMRNDSGT